MTAARQVRSYTLTQFGSPLKEVIESPPVPTGTQVLLRVRACGVCHSDIHLSEGYFDLGRERKADLSKAMQPPRILGHEIVGMVDELGPDASGVHVGDRRVIYGWCGCGQCTLCRTGQENLCVRPNNLGVHRDGGFSNYVLVDHPRYLVEFDPLPEAFAATLACSGLTAYSALKKAAPVDVDNPLLIIGAGGLGLAAVNLTRTVYGVSPAVADIDAKKRQAALDAGASGAIDPADPDTRDRLRKETGGFSSAIDFVGAESSTGFGLALLQRRTYLCRRPLRRLDRDSARHIAASRRRHSGRGRRLAAGVARIAYSCPRRPRQARADRDTTARRGSAVAGGPTCGPYSRARRPDALARLTRPPRSGEVRRRDRE
jgi:D-arabinose 1-dehydrogenase-like Zn-dependent alcohol dehydrogenase